MKLRFVLLGLAVVIIGGLFVVFKSWKFFMKPNMSEARCPMVVRTDFSDTATWNALKSAINAPVGREGFLACVEYVDNPIFGGKSKDELLHVFSEGYKHNFFVMADSVAISTADHPLLVVDLLDERGRAFRATPTAIQSIENNLSLANMGFSEYADAADEAPDHIFRGFSEPEYPESPDSGSE